MAKGLRSNSKRSARNLKRNDPKSVFRQTHDARAERLSAKLQEAARKPKRPRTPSPAPDAIEVEGEMELDEAPVASTSAATTEDRPVSSLRSSERKKLRKSNATRSKAGKRANLIRSFTPKRSSNRRSKSGTAKP